MRKATPPVSPSNAADDSRASLPHRANGEGGGGPAGVEQGLIQLLLAVATAANEADAPETAFQTALDRICAFTGWPVGHVYAMSEDGHLQPTTLWHLDDPDRFTAFREATERLTFKSGESLPGRVVAAARAAWVADAANDTNLVRAAEAARVGLRSAMAFPVLTGRDVVAVMEFFADEVVPPDEGLLDVMANVGEQLGRVVERKRATEALRASEERFRALVEDVLDYAIYMLDPVGHVVSWNRGGERIKGYREDEVIGRHFSLFYPPEDVAAGKPEWELEMARTHGRIEDEGWRVRRDGSRFWANVVVTALFGADGTLQGFSKVTRDLTERKRAEQALRESESRLARAQEIAHLGSWEWNVRTGQLTWSDEMYRVYGLEPGQGITYERYAAQIHPDDRKEHEQVVAESLRTHVPFSHYHRIVRASDGAERILLGEGEVIVDESGEVVRMFGTGHDVTERRMMEEELRERERLLRRAQEIAHFGSWEWNATTGVLTWSEELYRIYGLEPGAPVSYEHYLERIHPDDRAYVAEQVEAALRTQAPFSFQERIVRPDGSIRVLNSAGEVLLDPAGTTWLFGVCHDVTEAVEAERELRASEQRHRLLAENMTDLVSLHDPDGRFVYASPSAERILGYRPDELLGRLPTEFIHPDDLARVEEERAAQAAEGRAITELTYRMRTKDGAYVWLDLSSRAILDPDGRVTRILSSSRDVTQRVRAEQAEARSRAALEARNRELQDFAYVASHDLQEPLRKIRAFADLLLDDYGVRLDDTGRHYVGRMQDAAARMSNLITDLLSFSRVTTKANPFEPVDLGAVVEGVLSDLEMTVAEAGGHVEVEALPTIDADPLQMRQLFQNLIANALKFHRPGTAPRVRVSARVQRRNDLVPSAHGDVCVAAVEDNGIGFDEKYLDRIFTPFQRLHNREEYKGTGMGLAICRRIAERHGGTITARSKPGKGSTFIVVLPCRQETELAPEPG